MGCSVCGREADKIYKFENKDYCYRCYKALLLNIDYSKIEEQKKNNYQNQCSTLMKIFSSKEINEGCGESDITKQWNCFKEITVKQFKSIMEKLNKVEVMEYKLSYFENSKYIIDNNFDYGLNNNDMIKVFKNDERLHKLIIAQNESIIKMGARFYIVEIKYIDEVNSLFVIKTDQQLLQLKKDKFIEVLEVIEV